METMSTEISKKPESEKEEHEGDLELSDVPMDEINDEDEEDDDEDEADELDDDIDLYKQILNEDTRFIREKIFHDILTSAKSSDYQDNFIEKPLEELSEEDRKKLLVENLDPEQMQRYESYRRTPVGKPGVRKLVNTILNQSVSNNVSVVLAGVSKVFVGQIVVKALEVKKRHNKANYIIKLAEKKQLVEELERQETLLKQKFEENKSGALVDLSYIKHQIDQIKSEIKKIELKNINEKGPLLPEHIREAWRLYQLESGTAPSSQWRSQGERDGLLFR